MKAHDCQPRTWETEASGSLHEIRAHHSGISMYICLNVNSQSGKGVICCVDKPTGFFMVIIYFLFKAVNFICDHPDIKAISFVGSNQAGEYIFERGSRNGKRVQANMVISHSPHSSSLAVCIWKS